MFAPPWLCSFWLLWDNEWCFISLGRRPFNYVLLYYYSIYDLNPIIYTKSKNGWKWIIKPLHYIIISNTQLLDIKWKRKITVVSHDGISYFISFRERSSRRPVVKKIFNWDIVGNRILLYETYILYCIIHREHEPCGATYYALLHFLRFLMLCEKFIYIRGKS